MGLRLFGRPLELVILDVDGVIVEHHPHILNNMASVAVSMGLSDVPIRNFFKGFLEGTERGKSPFSEFVKYIWGDAVSEPGKVEEFNRRLQEHEAVHPYPAMPGSIDTVNWLRDKGIRVALSTNNKFVPLLDRLHKAGYSETLFAAIATSDGGYHKPDPRMLTDIFDKLSVPKEHSVFVGDWYPDIICASKAEVPFLAVLSGGVPSRCFVANGVPEENIMQNLAEIRQRVES